MKPNFQISGFPSGSNPIRIQHDASICKSAGHLGAHELRPLQSHQTAKAPPIHQRRKCSVVDQLEDAHTLPRLPCIRTLVLKRAHNVPNLSTCIFRNPETRRYFFETDMSLQVEKRPPLAHPCPHLPTDSKLCFTQQLLDQLPRSKQHR